MSSHAPNQARVIPLRPVTAPATAEAPPTPAPHATGAPDAPAGRGTSGSAPVPTAPPAAPASPTSPATPVAPPAPVKEPLWRDVVGDVLRRERLAQKRTLKDVADAARISMPYLSEIERGLKEASSEVLAAAAAALGLGIADLLALGHHEIIRLTGARGTPVPARTRQTSPTSRPASLRAPARQGDVRLAA
ncbi:helix-turn-helix transcriptional regulator [Streptomyces sp. NPDC047108]|uniref:helix-turn-helix domain-containing protein n=1 Tax=Streptomyces sp. NPDC047108 TaxID=3155025 RepID=UPI0033BFE084